MAFTLEEMKFVKISLDYLSKLYSADHEVFYSEQNHYENKPHVGILINNDGYDYVIPLTSAKTKHQFWKNKTQTNYLVYEIIRREECDENDIIKDLENTSEGETSEFVERIMSVLEIKKMIPIKDGVFEKIEFNNFDLEVTEERQRKSLLEKEYEFCLTIKDEIIEKANKIYEKQKVKGVLPFHCNFSLLETVCSEYEMTFH